MSSLKTPTIALCKEASACGKFTYIENEFYNHMQASTVTQMAAYSSVLVNTWIDIYLISIKAK